MEYALYTFVFILSSLIIGISIVNLRFSALNYITSKKISKKIEYFLFSMVSIICVFLFIKAQYIISGKYLIEFNYLVPSNIVLRIIALIFLCALVFFSQKKAYDFFVKVRLREKIIQNILKMIVPGVLVGSSLFIILNLFKI